MSDTKPSIEMIENRPDYLALARAQWARDGEIEFDNNAVVSLPDAEDGPELGAYVAAWVWVDRPGKE